ncbi:hypothetical protein M0R45_018921 [Rubus argutus]|uniref:peroxidase n=1 Tax=Rubus argutus TaxID=59490 RepID=A0AAW1X402_RUBAR
MSPRDESYGASPKDVSDELSPKEESDGLRSEAARRLKIQQQMNQRDRRGEMELKTWGQRKFVNNISRAHTIGTTACFFMEKRLHNFSSSAKSDPSINPEFLPKLKKKCPLGGDGNVRLPLDPATHDKFDVKPFQNLRRGFAVLASDARLMEDPVTRGVVESYLKSGGQVSFNKDFIQSILKLGAIGVKSAGEGEIRKSCSKLN